MFVFCEGEVCECRQRVSDGGPDPAGIFSVEKEARRCWITKHGHMPPSLMAVCHLISALRTMMKCSVDALLSTTQTRLTSTEGMKDIHTVEKETEQENMLYVLHVSFNIHIYDDILCSFIIFINLTVCCGQNLQQIHIVVLYIVCTFLCYLLACNRK